MSYLDICKNMEKAQSIGVETKLERPLIGRACGISTAKHSNKKNLVTNMRGTSTRWTTDAL